MKKYSLSSGIIEDVLELSKKRERELPKYNNCFNNISSNSNLHKNEELIKLSIFNVNKDKFHNLLNNTHYLKNCFFKNYFYECVKTYIYLNNQYCFDEKTGISNNKGGCQILSMFRDSYSSFLQDAERKGYELPNLLSSELYDAVSCTLEESKLESHPIASNNSYKSIPYSVSTAIGTMSAIPPILSLIYKFTPAGIWFRSKIKKRTKILDNTYEQIENELFYPSHKNAIINSSNSRYNVAYGRV
ncbi:hypothetical protein PCYB_004110 [Plasmodium cynomolgi strain B]|uniref:CYIR protein n=1 Tax=Plasmodium cynomolgi (strain B) TaxID=1120755 RepID=K6VJR7_PLACD|nr:hypothetical protein PCYB_004110 [Plasmodium cynomolgi strain B]GAB69662.1 hypothetical protein PCYB_004110 [Plasmodium cynomolgi strain B]